MLLICNTKLRSITLSISFCLVTSIPTRAGAILSFTFWTALQDCHQDAGCLKKLYLLSHRGGKATTKIQTAILNNNVQKIVKIIYNNILNEIKNQAMAPSGHLFPTTSWAHHRAARGPWWLCGQLQITSTSHRYTPRRYQWKLHLGRLRGRGGPW